MDYIEYGNSVMITLKRLELDEKIRGNTIPEELYHQLIDGYGKCYFLATIILSDIIYWYRPTSKTQNDGQVELTTKYSGDLLQKSIPSLAEKFNVSYDQVEHALNYLVAEGWISKEVRQGVRMPKKSKIWNNVLYIILNVEKLDTSLRGQKQEENKKQHLSTIFVQDSLSSQSYKVAGNSTPISVQNPDASQESISENSETNTDTTTKTLQQQNKTKTTPQQTLVSKGGRSSSFKSLIEELRTMEKPCKDRLNHFLNVIKKIDKDIDTEKAILVINRLNARTTEFRMDTIQIEMILRFCAVMGECDDKYSNFNATRERKDINGIKTKQGFKDLWLEPVKVWINLQVDVKSLGEAKMLGLRDGFHEKSLYPFSYNNKVMKMSPTSRRKDIYDDNWPVRPSSAKDVDYVSEFLNETEQPD